MRNKQVGGFPPRLASTGGGPTGSSLEPMLDAAEIVFARRGYDEARMQEIADAASISIDALHEAFRGKAEIYASVNERRVFELLSIASRVVGEHERAIDALRVGTLAYVDFLLDHPDYLHMHLREGYSWAAPTQFRSGEQVTGWERGVELMTELVRRAIVDGSLHRGEPSLVAKLMIAAHQVHLADWLALDCTEPREAVRKRILDHFERTFVRSPVMSGFQ